MGQAPSNPAPPPPGLSPAAATDPDSQEPFKIPQAQPEEPKYTGLLTDDMLHKLVSKVRHKNPAPEVRTALTQPLTPLHGSHAALSYSLVLVSR